MPYTSYTGGETPDPLYGCGFGAPSGPSLAVQFHGPPQVVSVTVTMDKNGAPAPVTSCWYTAATATFSPGDTSAGWGKIGMQILSAVNALVIFPQQPLGSGTYHVCVLTVGPPVSRTFGVGGPPPGTTAPCGGAASATPTPSATAAATATPAATAVATATATATAVPSVTVTATATATPAATPTTPAATATPPAGPSATPVIPPGPLPTIAPLVTATPPATPSATPVIPPGPFPTIVPPTPFAPSTVATATVFPTVAPLIPTPFVPSIVATPLPDPIGLPAAPPPPPAVVFLGPTINIAPQSAPIAPQQPPATGNPPVTGSVAANVGLPTSDWTTALNACIGATVDQQGTDIEGTYTLSGFSGASVDGLLSGTVSGNLLNGDISEPPNEGTFQIGVSADGSSYTG